MLYSVLYACFMEASSVLYSRFLPSTTATNIYLHPDYFSLLILCLLGLFYLDMLHTLWMHASKLNYVERRLLRLCVGRRGTPNVRFYDITSWSYVNLDDPLRRKKRGTEVQRYCTLNEAILHRTATHIFPHPFIDTCPFIAQERLDSTILKEPM